MARYLEIGSAEGYSLACVYGLLQGNVTITAIDPFSDIEVPEANWAATEARFSANVEALGATGVVRKLKGRSIDHLPRLVDAGELFDLTYIDGSHRTLDVIADAVLAWQLLAPEGLMIFDDYWYCRIHDGQLYQPKRAINAFVGMLGSEISVVDVGGQVFLRRRQRSGYWRRALTRSPFSPVREGLSGERATI